MKRSVPLCIALISCAAVATSAAAQGISQVSESSSGALTELKAQEAAVDGDWSATAALAGRAYRQSPSLNNEFNLATAYTRTGQTALAIPLYADVAAKGQFVQVTALYDYRHGGARPPRLRYNIADEANRRLTMLTGQPLEQPAEGTRLALP